jgi:YjbR
MVSIDTFRKIVCSFPVTTEEPHFEKASFRIKKKIFATYDAAKNRACIKLSEIDQNVFSSAAKKVIFPVHKAWGKQGWTLIEMSKVRKELFTDALTTPNCEVVPKKNSETVRPNSPISSKQRK